MMFWRRKPKTSEDGLSNNQEDIGNSLGKEDYVYKQNEFRSMKLNLNKGGH